MFGATLVQVDLRPVVIWRLPSSVPGPDHLRVQRALGDGEDGAVELGPGVIRGDRAPAHSCFSGSSVVRSGLMIVQFSPRSSV